MELKAIKTNKTLGITEGKTYKCWTVTFANYLIFQTDNDHGDEVLVPSSIFEKVER